MTGALSGTRVERGRRRGTIYVAVLSTALIVAIIGLAALLGARLLQWATSLTENAVRADIQAQTTIDRALLLLVNDANWRTRYAHDVWTAPQVLDGVTTSFKLVDELDGNLANAANQPVRLYGRAFVGDALRIYSVQLTPRVPRNLLVNADMEFGVSNWSGSGCVLEPVTDDVRGGTRAIYVRNRFGSSSGPRQELTAALQNGAPYNFEVWVKVDGVSHNIQLVIETTGSESGTQWFVSAGTLVPAAWTRVAATITPSWQGTLQSAAVYVITSSNTTAFRIDDASLTNANPRHALVVVPGTWRREILP
jgi:hypothetical protein